MKLLKRFKRRARYVYDLLRFQESAFPPEIWIENTNCCNAHCVMCPRDKLSRELGFMDLGLFERLVKEASSFGRQVKRVHLHNYGEPLLDKNILERIRIAKENGIVHTYFVTNGSLLSTEVSKGLIEAGLDEFKVSFYGTDPETYNATMAGLDFYTTFDNLKNFFLIRKGLESNKPSVIIQYLPQEANNCKTKNFFELFEKLIDRDKGDSLNIFPLHNYGGGRNYLQLGEEINAICDYPWRTMVILWDGRVVPCCLDYNGTGVIGDVNKDSIYDIWNGESYRKLRRDFKKLQYKPYTLCLHCERIR
jgi:MoaA/NifB/PqqE/SkfB family radical SAM enzyme